MRAWLAVVVLATACAPATDEQSESPQAASPPAIALPRWSADPEADQLGALDPAALAAIPACADQVPVFTGTAVGPLQPGQNIREVAEVCPQGLAVWDLGSEAIPEPALLVRFGPALIQLTMSDTTRTGLVDYIRTSAGEVSTAVGVHPGTLFSDAARAYGPATVQEAECVVYATFSAASNMSFRLDLGGAIDCADLALNSADATGA